MLQRQLVGSEGCSPHCHCLLLSCHCRLPLCHLSGLYLPPPHFTKALLHPHPQSTVGSRYEHPRQLLFFRLNNTLAPSSMVLSVLLLVGSSAALLASDHVASAHSAMLAPKAVFKSEPDMYSAVGNVPTKQFTFDPSIPDYKGWDRAVDAIKRSGSKTVRQFLMKYMKPNQIALSKECGNTILTGAKQPLPDHIDFPWGHEGPCELWCDNTRIFYDGNCNGNKVGKVKVDMNKCKGASIVQGMYIGTQAADWEVYINCAPIVGGTSTDPTILKTPTSTTKKPASKAPASGSSKCTRKRKN